MKRDMELIRLLLLQYETGARSPELANHSKQEIIYNLVLMRDASLIEAQFIEGNKVLPDDVMDIRLTWAGHDFLDATRDSTVWKLAKEHILKPGASWTFSILLDWLKQEIHKKVFGIPPSS